MQFIGVPLTVGAISYESSGTFNYQVMWSLSVKSNFDLNCLALLSLQTLINKISAYIYTVALGYSLVSFNLYCCLFLTGPLPAIFCDIQALQVLY